MYNLYEIKGREDNESKEAIIGLSSPKEPVEAIDYEVTKVKGLKELIRTNTDTLDRAIKPLNDTKEFDSPKENLKAQIAKYYDKYLRWKSRYKELEKRYEQLQKMYMENMKELQKYVGF